MLFIEPVLLRVAHPAVSWTVLRLVLGQSSPAFGIWEGILSLVVVLRVVRLSFLVGMGPHWRLVLFVALLHLVFHSSAWLILILLLRIP